MKYLLLIILIISTVLCNNNTHNNLRVKNYAYMSNSFKAVPQIRFVDTECYRESGKVKINGVIKYSGSCSPFYSLSCYFSDKSDLTGRLIDPKQYKIDCSGNSIRQEVDDDSIDFFICYTSVDAETEMAYAKVQPMKLSTFIIIVSVGAAVIILFCICCCCCCCCKTHRSSI